MTRPGSGHLAGLPGDHPDDDLLADLAADVLPAEQAGPVEQHVVGCARCAGLLAEAEGVRPLLLADPVEAIPADIAARIDAAVRRAALWGDLADTGVMPPVTGVMPPVTGPLPPVTGSLPQESFFDEPYPTSAIPVGSMPVGAPVAGARLRRPSRPGTRTRRQVREEERDSRPVWRRPVFAIAASLLVVAGLGLGLRQLAGGPSFTSTASSAGGSTSSGSEAARAPAASDLASTEGVPVLATGTDYTKGGLSAQAKTLIARAGAQPGTPRTPAPLSAGSGGGPADSTQAPTSHGQAFSATPEPSPAKSAAPGQLLRDPAALAACLVAIQSAGIRPVAVDLARYQGQEAAVLVLPAPAGGYEVWVVSRDCRPGADGAITFIPVR